MGKNPSSHESQSGPQEPLQIHLLDTHTLPPGQIQPLLFPPPHLSPGSLLARAAFSSSTVTLPLRGSQRCAPVGAPPALPLPPRILCGTCPFSTKKPQQNPALAEKRVSDSLRSSVLLLFAHMKSSLSHRVFGEPLPHSWWAPTFMVGTQTSLKRIIQ